MANLLKELPESVRPDYQFAKDFLAKPKRPEPVEWRDHIFFPGFEPETVEYALEHHEPGDNEILIISYPKTGTTWTREIVRQILYGRDEKLDLITQDLTPIVIYLEAGSEKKYNVLNHLPIPRKYYVTHLPPELVNVEKYKRKNMKFIYTIRNPKDRMVSMFHFAKKFPLPLPYDTNDWNSYFQAQLKGGLATGMRKGEDYLEHILRWLPHIENNDDALTLVYEEMIENPEREIRRIVDFLEVKLSDEEVLKICEKTSFSSMKKSDKESTSEDATTRKSVELLRKGQIGDWKNYFTPEQSAIVDAEVEKKLKGTGIKFIYE